MLGRVRLFATPWTLALQAPLCMEFFSQHFLLQGIFSTQGLNPGLPDCRQTLHCLNHQWSQQNSGQWSHINADPLIVYIKYIKSGLKIFMWFSHIIIWIPFLIPEKMNLKIIWNVLIRNDGLFHREQTYGHGERGGEGEIHGESNIETYITICKIDSGNLLYVSGNSNRGCVST